MNLDTLLQKVKALNKEKKFQEVIDALPNEVLAKHKNADIYVEKAQAYYRSGKEAESKEMAEQALSIQPNHARGNHYLGNWFNYYRKEYNKAIAHYEKAIAADPNDAYPYNGLGNVYFDLREYDKAIECYQNAIAIDSNYAHPYNGLGNVYYRRREYDKAIAYFQKAIAVDSNFAYPYNGMGNVYEDLKEYGKAIEYYQRAIAAYPNMAGIYYNIGLTYKNAEQYQMALQAFEKFIAFTANNGDDFTLRALRYVEELKKILQNVVYAKLRKIVDEIKALLLFKETCVTHYTSLSTAKSMISEGSPFRLSEGAFLNDTSEGRNLNEYLDFQNTASDSNGTLAKLFFKKPFIGSFVKEKQDNNLTLWRMYGKESKEEAKGCAITVDVEKLKTLLQETATKSKSDGGGTATNTGEIFEFYKVAYRKKEGDKFVLPGAQHDETPQLNTAMKRLKEAIAEFNSSPEADKEEGKKYVTKLLNEITYLFKGAEYEHEHEVRLVVDSDNGFPLKINHKEDGAPKVYIEIGDIRPLITKLTLGPKVERSDEWASVFCFSFKAQRGINDPLPDIYISHLPFK